MSVPAILRALRRGPATNAELQELLCEHGGAIARDCAKLIHRGQVRHIDGATGRGRAATYALTETH
jgi:hypothetical protein